MHSILWLIAAPLLFVLPGLLPARLVTGHRFSTLTFAWALFFGIMLLPPLCFGLAMLLGTVVDGWLVVPTALAMGLAGVFFPKPIYRNGA